MATVRRAGGPATPATPPPPPTAPIVPATSRLKMKPIILTLLFLAAFGLLGYYIIYDEKPKKKRPSSVNNNTNARTVQPNNKWDYYQLQKAGDKYSIDVPEGHHTHTFGDSLYLFQRDGQPIDTVGGIGKAKRKGSPYDKEEKSIEISFFQTPVKVTVLTAENGNCKYEK